MFCKECGREIYGNAQFCGACGARVPNGLIQQTKPPKTPFKKELKESMQLIIIPLIYIAVSILRRYLLNVMVWHRGNAVFHLELVYDVFQIVTGILWGTLSYVAIKWSIKTSLVFITPYLIYNLIYPFLYGSFSEVFLYPDYTIDYFGGIILPFAIIGVLQFLKKSRLNQKNPILVGVISPAIAMLLFFVYLTVIFSLPVNQIFIIELEEKLQYLLGAVAISFILHFAYRKNKGVKQ